MHTSYAVHGFHYNSKNCLLFYGVCWGFFLVDDFCIKSQQYLNVRQKKKNRSLLQVFSRCIIHMHIPISKHIFPHPQGGRILANSSQTSRKDPEDSQCFKLKV